MSREIIKIDIDQIAEIEGHHTEVEVIMDKVIEEDHVYINNYRNEYRRDNFRNTQNYRGQNFRGGYRRNYRNVSFGRGRSGYRDRCYLRSLRRNNRSSSRSTSGSRASTNRDRIRCYKCGEYDHFPKDCPTLQVEKESDQIQQVNNTDEEKTALKSLAADTYDNLNRVNSVDENIVNHLNL